VGRFRGHRALYAASLILAALLATIDGAYSQESPEWSTLIPTVEATGFVERLPIKVLQTKLFLELELGSRARSVVFNTGSPSVLSKPLATELGLEIIDTIQSVDANGTPIEHGVALLDELRLGELSVRNVPVIVADLSRAPIANCLFDAVLGSEIFQICNWQIDVAGQTLTCADRLEDLTFIDGSVSAPLRVLGYPYSPMLDTEFQNGMTSTALFDTGSPEYVGLTLPEFEDLERSGEFELSAMARGFGSSGESLGGMGQDEEAFLLSLSRLWIGDLELVDVVARTREEGPSLIGASLLENYIVTLAYPSRRAYFYQYSEAPLQRTSFGFGPDFDTQTITASFVWEESPAYGAGIRPGDRLMHIGDSDLTAITEQNRCTVVRDVLESLDDDAPLRVDFEREGTATTVELRRQLVLQR
jgi:hypothetical protein